MFGENYILKKMTLKILNIWFYFMDFHFNFWKKEKQMWVTKLITRLIIFQVGKI